VSRFSLQLLLAGLATGLVLVLVLLGAQGGLIDPLLAAPALAIACVVGTYSVYEAYRQLFRASENPLDLLPPSLRREADADMAAHELPSQRHYVAWLLLERLARVRQPQPGRRSA
jgi:hypothetical protein